METPNEAQEALEQYDEIVAHIRHELSELTGKAALVDVAWRASETKAKTDTCKWILRGQEQVGISSVSNKFRTDCGELTFVTMGGDDMRLTPAREKYCPFCGRSIETNDEE